MTRRFQIAAAILVVAAAACRPRRCRGGALCRARQADRAVSREDDAYKINLTNAKGKLVKTLKAGTYTFVIHDDSTFHNYELDGPPRQVVDVHDRSRHGHEDRHAEARRGQLQGVLLGARVGRCSSTSPSRDGRCLRRRRVSRGYRAAHALCRSRARRARRGGCRRRRGRARDLDVLRHPLDDRPRR